MDLYMISILFMSLRHKWALLRQMTNNEHLAQLNTMLAHIKVKLLLWVTMECIRHTNQVLFLLDFMQYKEITYFLRDLTSLSVSSI